MLTLKDCPVCGSSELAPEISDLKPNLDQVPGRYGYARCRTCSMVFLNPRPENAALTALYDHLPGSRTVVVETGETGWVRRMWSTLSNPSYAKILAALPHGRVLDVGCGQGDLVDALRRTGREASGVDFSPATREAAVLRGLDLTPADLNTFVPAADSYDGIVLRHVLEHIADPVDLVRRLRSGLKPGGTILIETPHFNSITRRLMGKDWNGWDAPFHLNQFTMKSISKTLQLAGYAAIKPCTFGVVDELRRSYGRRVNREARYDVLRATALPLYWMAGLVGGGSSLLVTAERG